MPVRDRRTVHELLADCDRLTREALLDMSADRASGMVRGWSQLIHSAAELWAVLPRDPTVSANGDPMPSWPRWAERLAAASPGTLGRARAAPVEAACELWAAIDSAIANQTGWATPEHTAPRTGSPRPSQRRH